MPRIGIAQNMNEEMIGPGEYTLTLYKVDLVEQDDIFSDEPGAKKERLIWSFRDPESGKVHKEWTGTIYGSPRAALTKFLDRLIPGITKDEADDLDTDTLLGRTYSCVIENRTTQKGDVVSSLPFFRPTGNTVPVETPKPAAKTSAAQPPAPAPAAVPSNGSEINRLGGEIIDRLMESGYGRSQASAVLRNACPDKGDLESVKAAWKQADYLGAIVSDLHERGHRAIHVEAILRQHLTNPLDGEQLERLNAMVHSGAFEMESEAPAPAVPQEQADDFKNPWETAGTENPAEKTAASHGADPATPAQKRMLTALSEELHREIDVESLSRKQASVLIGELKAEVKELAGAAA